MFSFLAATLCTLLILELPFFLPLKTGGFSARETISISPLISIATYCILGVLFEKLSIPANFCSLFLTALIIGVLVFLIIVFKKQLTTKDVKQLFTLNRSKINLVNVVSFVIVVLCFFLFFHEMKYSTYVSNYDSVFHINLVRSFLDSQIASSFDPSLYLASNFDSPAKPIGFYPVAWHTLVYMVGQLSGIYLPIVCNAVNFTLVGFVFPLGVASLCEKLFDNKFVVSSSYILSVMFLAFPFVELLGAEQYPQIMGFALVPAACCSFLKMFEGKKFSCFALLMFLTSVVSLIFSQSNTVFTVGIFIFAYCVFNKNAFKFTSFFKVSKTRRIALSLCLAIIFIAVWIILFKSPPLQKVVNYTWPSFTSPIEAIFDALVGCHFSQSDVGQPIAGILVLASIIFIFYKKENRWLIFPWIFCFIALVCCSSTEGFLKHFLGGFWYTEPKRIGAQLVIFSLPLVVFTVSSTLSFICRKAGDKESQVRVFSPLLLTALILLSWIVPLPTSLNSNASSAMDVVKSFCTYYNSPNSELILSNKEKEFCESALAKIDNSSVILNVPDDGSCFLYGLYDSNIYYRRNYISSATDPNLDSMIRKNLSNYQQSPDLKEALEKIGAKYVLLLDKDIDAGLFHTFNKDEWSGFYDISQSTQGFKLISHSDDCYLYEIEY